MMLDFLGNGDERYHTAHDGILATIGQTIACGPKTPDMKAVPQRSRLARLSARPFSVITPPLPGGATLTGATIAR
ncbi:hypothetical protein LNQ52_29555 [Klebsiella pneumoniae subsp. pneumoniae]|nr:hypothetical protein [Klebsiella pneumoniae subsp. pneumoniae]